MKLVRARYPLKYVSSRSVVTVGNFDGIHLGHQALLHRLKQESRALNLPAILMIFEPLSKEFFALQQRKVRLMRFREKWFSLKNYDIDEILCLRFDQHLADLSPERFVEEILVKQLHIAAIIVGDDFRFGAKRAGTTALLRQMGLQHNFSVISVPTVEIAGERVSSTRIRAALQAGCLEEAQQLLGRPFSVMGKVIYGKALGRRLGFPTANIDLHREWSPVTGVFVVRVRLSDEQIHRGVAYVGTRPTLKETDNTRILLEVNLLDFDTPLYGQLLQVEFLHQLRNEEDYPSLGALTQQIQQDVIDARRFFSE
ncbi:MAG: riboflavin biosynthesis protein RibF [Coxiella sp. RIFCSPHIGHO2_12_FULL_44_14]|nr:MAG: riboflavin biosynthesis protein RibF [Coxiella sp. RIFCSPHIGHO2_12_FULL_44_14]